MQKITKVWFSWLLNSEVIKKEKGETRVWNTLNIQRLGFRGTDWNIMLISYYKILF